jgi:ethanolaminephosphotransferase
LIKPELAHHVHSYAPKSSCFSPYYTYVQSPLCDYLVSYLPTWLAPNLITISGFMILVLTHLLMLYLYGTSTEGPMETWFCVFIGLAYTVYSTLDNIDGK